MHVDNPSFSPPTPTLPEAPPGTVVPSMAGTATLSPLPLRPRPTAPGEAANARPGPARRPDDATIGVDEMVRLTGVKAERLRTWERRYGFPSAKRAQNGSRWFRPTDVAAVISVSRAIARGARVGQAIEQARMAAEPHDGAAEGEGAFLGAEAILGSAPTPALIVAGSRDLPVVWRNPALRAAGAEIADGMPLGAVLPGLADGDGRRALVEVLNGERGSAFIEHDDWTSPVRARVGALTWALGQEAFEHGSHAVVLQLPAGTADWDDGSTGRRNAATERSWTRAVREARVKLHARDHEVGLRESLKALCVRIGAVDAVLATYTLGTLMAARSVRGAIEPTAVDLGVGDALARALTDGAVDWLGAGDRARLGIDAPEVVMVPITISTEPVGALFLALRGEVALDDLVRELLLSYGTAVGLILLFQRRGRLD